ncbi:MAG: serine--tRNA ligase [Deltaproteobacteria bacterium]|nr:serine--tRNA ligase [Deltaproteobacteria bacterium]MBI3293705.1 serine--tRNA ligase [Deltaproteobacteria bacterium]
MLDLRFIVENVQDVRTSLEKRGAVALLPVLKQVEELDKKRRGIILTVEELKAKRNKASQEIGQIKKSGGDASAIMTEMKTVSDTIKLQDDELAKCQDEILKLQLEIPNVLQATVVPGKDSAHNQQVRQWGEPRKIAQPKSHDEIGEKMGILDFNKAGLVTGARFVFLKGVAARLERALIQFMMDTHSAHGYEEMIPPFIVNRQSLVGTGQLPKFEEDVFKLQGHEYFLIPTAEVPVTNYHRDDILAVTQLPRRYVAYSPCFRSEAGNYGKDTKGMKRQHQFQKVELVAFAEPEKSSEEHERLTGDAERILKCLELPYRVMALCGGDTGFSSSKTYDLEVWLPGANAWSEISSCSNFGDFQARRANIRYRDVAGKVRFVHTLNGSGLAIGRTVIAILENYQKPDGTFDIPTALKKYMA